jgi:hypothetical protein
VLNTLGVDAERGDLYGNVNVGPIQKDESEEFTVENNADGSYSIISVYSDFQSALTVAEKRLDEGANIQQGDINGGDEQKWVFIPAFYKEEYTVVTEPYNPKATIGTNTTTSYTDDYSRTRATTLPTTITSPISREELLPGQRTEPPFGDGIVLDLTDTMLEIYTTDTFLAPNFSVMVQPEEPVSVGETSKHAVGYYFTKQLEFYGAGTIASRSLRVSAETEGTLYVFASTQTRGTTTNVILTDEDGKEICHSWINTDYQTQLNIEIPSAGTYYLMSEDNGFNLYYAELTDDVARKPVNQPDPDYIKSDEVREDEEKPLTTSLDTVSPQPCTPTIYGDLNSDSKAQLADVVYLCQAIGATDISEFLDPQALANADVYADGVINSTDLSVFANAMVNSKLSSLPILP